MDYVVGGQYSDGLGRFVQGFWVIVGVVDTGRRVWNFGWLRSGRGVGDCFGDTDVA